MELQFTGKEVPLVELPIGVYRVHPLMLTTCQGERCVFGYAQLGGERWEDRLPVMQVGDRLYGIETRVLAGAAVAAKRESER